MHRAQKQIKNEGFAGMYHNRSRCNSNMGLWHHVIWLTTRLVTVFGPTIIVLSMDGDDLEQAGGEYEPVRAPVSAVVDTMEALMDGQSGDYKRLHASVDSGFIHVSSTYTGESVRRVRDDSGQLVDTDDSGADFEVSSMPDPGLSGD